MSDLFDGYDDPDVDEEEGEEFVADPASVAFLDQQQAEWESERADFRQYYGFDHACQCAQDYSEGNLKEVTECFMTLTAQALRSSAEKTHELRLLSAILDQMLKLNNDLVTIMEQNGLGKELEEYFNEPVELEEDGLAVDFEQLEIGELEIEDADEPEDTEQ